MKSYKFIFTLSIALCLGILTFMLIGYLVTPESTPTTDAPTKPTPEITTKLAPSVYYRLTDEERDLVERVVMAEAGGEPHEGQMAVAQCILNACLLDGIRPEEVIVKYKYTDARPTPTNAVKMAVEAVFDKGEKVIDSEAKYFYAPNLVKSEWHESQVYICTIGSHRFFKEAKVIG